MKKYRTGYTTGVYDMFHVGHLNVIRRAKELCDFLIVGVSTDELVRQYKHKTPVIRFEERKAIVEAVRYVDKVVPQTTLDKMEAWERLRYDVLFQGSDWKPTPDKRAGELGARGVDIVLFDRTDGVSSTELAHAIGAMDVPPIGEND